MQSSYKEKGDVGSHPLLPIPINISAQRGLPFPTRRQCHPVGFSPFEIPIPGEF